MKRNVRHDTTWRQEGRKTALFFAGLLACLIMLLTLWPLPQQSYRSSISPITCLVCGDQGVQDVFQNILMFLPLGVALGFAGFGARAAGALGFGLSLLVEGLQYGVITGRDASLSDLLTNTLGAVLGATLAPRIPRLLAPGRSDALRVSLGVAASWAVLWLFGAWAAGDNPGQGRWRGRFPNDLPDVPALSGEAVSAIFNGAPLALIPAALPAEVEQLYARDSFALIGHVRPAVPAASRENMVTVIDSRPEGTSGYLSSMVFTLNRGRQWALLVFRINGSSLKLRTPTFNMGPMFDVAPGTDVYFTLARARGTLTGTSHGASEAVETTYRLGPELLYSMLAPRNPRTTLVWQVESFLWATLLLGLAGWFAGQARSRVVLGAILLAAIAVQFITPALFPVAPQVALGWFQLLGGLALGYGAGSVAYLRRGRPRSG